MRISDWSSDVCSSDLVRIAATQHARQHIEDNDRPGVADMRVAVDRRPADVHRHLLGIKRDEFFLVAGKRVVKLHGSGGNKTSEGYYESPPMGKIGRASRREREWQYVSDEVDGESLKKKHKKKI